MSSAIEAVPAKTGKTTSDWSLWVRQIGAIFRLEIEKNFLGRRAILIYLLAFLPLFPLMILALFTPPGNEWQDFNNYSLIYSGLYNALILRTVVFFGSAWIFMNLFRGEIIDRSLHYYFLSAVRREVLVFGKFISGLVTSMILFTGTTVIAMLLLYFPHFYSQSLRYFTEGRGLTQILTYAGITMLACLGYGAFAVRELLTSVDPALFLGGADSLGVAVGFDSGDFVLLGELTADGLTPIDPGAM